MIREFIDFWPLFGDTWLAGGLIAALLAAIGVLVVARDQIFIGAAISQISMLGIAVAHRLEPHVEAHILHAVVGGGCSIAAALFTARAGRVRGESHEAVTGWVFLLGASASVLVVAHSKHGLEEVQKLVLSASIIGATATDKWIFGAMLAVTALALALAHARILLVVTDPEMAGAAGVRVRRWERAILVWLGLGVGLSIHVAGMTYAFGCLVLPALVAKNLCREVKTMFVVAPLVGVAGAFAAFVLANHYDYPPGQTAVALLCALLAVAWAFRRAVGR